MDGQARRHAGEHERQRAIRSLGAVTLQRKEVMKCLLVVRAESAASDGRLSERRTRSHIANVCPRCLVESPHGCPGDWRCKRTATRNAMFNSMSHRKSFDYIDLRVQIRLTLCAAAARGARVEKMRDECRGPESYR